jgi:hypothetical protein
MIAAFTAWRITGDNIFRLRVVERPHSGRCGLLSCVPEMKATHFCT